MSINIELLPGESLIFEEGVVTSKPMVFGVSGQAIYVTLEQHFKQESWRLERIPISQVTEISLRKERSLVLWILGGLTFTGGSLLAAGLAWNVYNALPGTRVPIVPWPFIFMVFGILMPIVGRGRRILTVRVGNKIYRWKAGVLGDKKQEIHSLQDRLVEACRSVGISVADA